MSSISGVRLPRWLLPAEWPSSSQGPALARLDISEGRITQVSADDHQPTDMNLGGRLALPPLMDAHCHLDKVFTRSRIGELQPGLLAAIQAITEDRDAHWTRSDLLARAERAMEQAWSAGVRHLRTHVDWWQPSAPTAWETFAELKERWRHRIHLERVALVPLPLFSDPKDAQRIAAQVAQSEDALLGDFIHTSNFSHLAVAELLRAANEQGLNLDLHVDEELHPSACGIETVADLARQMDFAGHISAGHVCALSAKPRAEALPLLDKLARAKITLIALPTCNLLLQDAVPEHTPLARGITLIKEARSRDIPLLIGSDNVQDPFFPYGRQDPMNAFQLGVVAAQLEQPFDNASQFICRTDWLTDSHKTREPTLIGAPAELLVFDTTDALSWPSDPGRHWLSINNNQPVLTPLSPYTTRTNA
ncbi:amidohydrolase family protein [Carnimonas nigrificans]|uniref:amidohydrolase family protein n=1 Tax=Carnimonas nigrificans TaxID=64323 RepID=UPI00046FB86E|nr:amidohydrolase family protein [Carnimonas nigrificans]